MWLIPPPPVLQSDRPVITQKNYEVIDHPEADLPQSSPSHGSQRKAWPPEVKVFVPNSPMATEVRWCVDGGGERRVCVCVCVCLSICLCMHVCLSVCLSVSLSLSLYADIPHVCACVCACLYSASVCVCVCVCLCVFVCECVFIFREGFSRRRVCVCVCVCVSQLHLVPSP